MNEIPMTSLATAIDESGARQIRNQFSNLWRHQNLSCRSSARHSLRLPSTVWQTMSRDVPGVRRYGDAVRSDCIPGAVLGSARRFRDNRPPFVFNAVTRR